MSLKKHSLRRRGYKSFKDWDSDPNHIYIGRNMSHCVPGALGSKWGNPFKLKKANKNSLKQCLKRYEDHIRRNPDLFNAVMELEGKEIGCWCKPFPCHGDILIKLFKERQCTNSFSKSHQEFIPVLTQCGSNEDDVYSRNTESDLSASDSHDTVEGSNCYPSKGNLNQGRCVEECLSESFPSIFAPLRLRGVLQHLPNATEILQTWIILSLNLPKASFIN